MSKLANYRARLRASVVLPLAAVAALAAGGVSPALAKGASYEVLYNFANTPDGAEPYANLMKDKSGNLYGTTAYGGNDGCGTVFEITTSGTETVLHSFQDTPDGREPGNGTLIEDSTGNLYGTTAAGGTYGQGTVFELAPNGTETVLYSFGSSSTDAQSPYVGLTADSKGNLYGTTRSGGAYNDGAAFEVAPDGTETVLYSFVGSEGAHPDASLLRSGDNFYGTTLQGGADNYGTVFDLVKGKKGAWTENVLYSFTGGADGYFPETGLIKDSTGNLYGTAYYGGGTGCSGSGCGTVFELAPDGTFTVLYSFQGGSDGANPAAAVRLAKNGDLYGATEIGGSSNYGTVFQLAPDGTETVLHSFAGAPDGRTLFGGGPLTGIGGYLYGTTYFGGSSDNCTAGCGTVFRIKE